MHNIDWVVQLNNWIANRQSEVNHTTKQVGEALFVYVGYIALSICPIIEKKEEGRWIN